MKSSVKAVLTGAGVILGLQLILSILVKIYAQAIAQAQTEPLIAGIQFNNLFLAVSLGTFFIGGLIVGFMQERLALGVPIAVAILGLAVCSFVFSVFSLPDNIFLVGYAQKGAWGSFIVTVAGGVLVTALGALSGERVKSPIEDDPVARTVLVIALGVVLMAPFYFLIPYGLPWYIAVIITLVILVLVGIGYYLFTEGPTFEEDIEEISISPERR